MGFKENIAAYLKRMDILMITSDHEGLPMNLLEALCLKVPVISHSVGGITKVLGNGDYGTLVKNQDINEYTKAVSTYIDNADTFTKKANDGYNFIIDNYSAGKNAGKYLTLYKNLLNNE